MPNSTSTQTGDQTTLSIPQAMQLATQHYAKGDLQSAHALLQKILQVTPQNAPALHLLGVIFHQSGNTETAINVINQALSITPDNGQYHANIAEMHRLSGHLDQAVKHAQQAVKLNPNSAAAHSNLGIAYYDQGRYDLAWECQQKALTIDPKLQPAINNLGSICRQNKQLEEAAEHYRKVLEINPQHVESINNLGAVLTEMEQPNEALPILAKALQLNPNYAEAHCNIGMAFLTLENLEKAELGFTKALQLKPNYAEAYQGVAKLKQEQKDLPTALEMAKKALELEPESAGVHALLGNLYAESGYPELSAEAYNRALELDADSIAAYLGRGRLMMELGDMEAAEADYLKALSLDDSQLAARIALAQVKKMDQDDPNLQLLIDESKNLDTMLDSKAVALHFALGKAFDDTKHYSEAFNHYLEGCRIKRQKIHYNADDTDQAVNAVKAFFSKEQLEAMRGEGCDSDAPIFVLGMPRSGTTLTEQIIASHPEVHGAGELPDLLQLAHRPNGWETVGYPHTLKGFSHNQFKQLGERYVSGLKERNPEAKHITDKMPANFNCLGLVHLMLPNAKIVHVKRNPIDTCLSGFSRLFNSKSQLHSYDLAEMGRYYRSYHELMEHWREVLPEGSFYEIQYEDLVANTEDEAKALIDYCGLEWDDACLEFHKTERSIRTASVTQVRQPIYKTSVERWRAYEEHLTPLFEALGDLAPAR